MMIFSVEIVCYWLPNPKTSGRLREFEWRVRIKRDNDEGGRV